MHGASRKKVRLVYHWVPFPLPLFVLLLLSGREKDKKTQSDPSLKLLKTALSRLDVGPAYYKDPVSSNPTYTKKNAIFPFIYKWGSRGSYAAAFPGPFLLVLRPKAIA